MTTSHEISRNFAVEVVRKLRAAGHHALWAGGCVRDHLMGRTPKDYDVATDAIPSKVREIFGHKRTIPVGQSFGVITVLGPHGASPIEVATFREDAGYSDGRHPDSVRFSTPEKDAQRRDFTINGLFYDPMVEEVLDYVGGQQDLAAGVLRAIGDPEQRFDEDRLRMLRALRFANDFGFQIDRPTWIAIERRSAAISEVSPERIAAELRRMMASPRRGAALESLIASGLLRAVLPEISGVLESNPIRFQRTLAALTELALADFSTALGLLIDVAFESESDGGFRREADSDAFSAAAVAIQTADRLRLSNVEREIMQQVISARPLLVRADRENWPELQPFLVGKYGREVFEAGRAWRGIDAEAEAYLSWCAERLAWEPERLNPKPLVDGGTLRGLGWEPGPKFGEWIQRVRRLQLLGELSTREEAIVWIVDQQR